MALDNVLPLDAASRVLARDDYTIGELLVAEGRLGPSEVERIIDLHHRSALHFGEAAQRLGLLDENEVQAALARQYGLPQLLPGEDGASPELVAAFQPQHPCTEELRGLRTQLLLRWMNSSNKRRVLAIISPNHGDGRSYLAANLAIVFSQLGLRTLLIDADLRNPRQHEIFNVSNRIGLSTVLAGRADGNAVSPVPGCPKLSLLPAGANPPNPQELLSHLRMPELLSGLSQKYDIILMDTSAARAWSDSKSVAFRAGNALLLARKNHTPTVEMNNIVRELNDTGTEIVGTVINAF